MNCDCLSRLTDELSKWRERLPLHHPNYQLVCSLTAVSHMAERAQDLSPTDRDRDFMGIKVSEVERLRAIEKWANEIGIPALEKYVNVHMEGESPVKVSFYPTCAWNAIHAFHGDKP